MKDVQHECRTARFLRVYWGTAYIGMSFRFGFHIFSLSIVYYKHLQIFSILFLFFLFYFIFLFYFYFYLTFGAFYPSLTQLGKMRYIKNLIQLGEGGGINTKPAVLETLLQSPSFVTSYFVWMHTSNLAQSSS